jgi:hypothetical protein
MTGIAHGVVGGKAANVALCYRAYGDLGDPHTQGIVNVENGAGDMCRGSDNVGDVIRDIIVRRGV